jgi:hypothetical protein
MRELFWQRPAFTGREGGAAREIGMAQNGGAIREIGVAWNGGAVRDGEGADRHAPRRMRKRHQVDVEIFGRS